MNSDVTYLKHITLFFSLLYPSQPKVEVDWVWDKSSLNLIPLPLLPSCMGSCHLTHIIWIF